jgi:hypothetical protein
MASVRLELAIRNGGQLLCVWKRLGPADGGALVACKRTSCWLLPVMIPITIVSGDCGTYRPGRPVVAVHTADGRSALQRGQAAVQVVLLY